MPLRNNLRFDYLPAREQTTIQLRDFDSKHD